MIPIINITYENNSMQIYVDDGNDVWIKTISKEDIDYGFAKTKLNSIYGFFAKGDNSNETR